MKPNSAGRGIGRVFSLFGAYPAVLMFGLLKIKRTIRLLSPASECGRNSGKCLTPLHGNREVILRQKRSLLIVEVLGELERQYLQGC